LAHNVTTPWFGREPKARVATMCVFIKTFNVVGQMAFEDDSLTTNWWNVATTNYMLDHLSQNATSKLASSSFHF
jgi:hypothetical protein